MKAFMDEHFLLETETARHLFHDVAKNLPIVDYHCHISAKEIYEDRRFDNLAQVWLGGRNLDGTYFGDHYKWRVMRSCGVPEEIVTGATDGKVRIETFAKCLEQCIGNPMVHWCNLELQRFFGVKEWFCSRNAGEIYEECSRKLREDPGMTVRGLIRQSNVEFIGTTEDPIDTLEWHEKLAQEKDLGFSVCPAIRPDKALNIGKDGFVEYMAQLAQSVGKTELKTAREVCDALVARTEFFKAHGCVASDHGLDYIPYRPASPEEVDAIYVKKMAGGELTLEEVEKYQTLLLMTLGHTYHRLGIAMEIHYSCLRSVNDRRLAQLGRDSGFDMIGQTASIEPMVAFLNALDATDQLPRTIIYSLNPADDELIGSLLGCFQSDEIPGKMQQGSAWWFNDTKSGMEHQMKSLANLGVLGTFVGMLTDSRSFLSYTRHEYFRRILCNLVGDWVENGEFPADEDALRTIIENICCRNAERYFNL